MASDKRTTGSERSGRHGSASDRDSRSYRDEEHKSRRRESEHRRSSDRRSESEYRRSSDDRRSERNDDYRERDSSERHRVRRNTDRSEDGSHSDGDYLEHDFRRDFRDEPESTCIVLWGLPIRFTGLNIRKLVEQGEGPKPADVRLMKKRKGISRGFAFVDFFDLQDATTWMEANQNKLVIEGKDIQMRYTKPPPKHEDWLCDKCQEFNFRRRSRCFRCHAHRSECEKEVPSDHSETSATLILSNIDHYTLKESIATAVSPHTSRAIVNIRLIKDEQTQLNRGFAFVQLATKLEAAELLQNLQSLDPPFKIDGRQIRVGFSQRIRKQQVPLGGNRVAAFSVAKKENAAAQWLSTQSPGEAGDYTRQDSSDQHGQNSQQYRRFYQDDRDASSAAGTGSSTVTSSVVASQRPQLFRPTGSLLGLVAAYSGDSDEEEQEQLVETDEDRWTDLKKMACLLCRRQFPNRAALTRHQQLSDLHKQNLESYRSSKISEQDKDSLEQRETEMKYLDRVAEHQEKNYEQLSRDHLDSSNMGWQEGLDRKAKGIAASMQMKYVDRDAEHREKYGIPEPSEPKRKRNYEQLTRDHLDTNNIGNNMGWQEGMGMNAQGITAPIQEEVRERGAGLGDKGGSYRASRPGSYKEAVRKAMFARFKELE